LLVHHFCEGKVVQTKTDHEFAPDIKNLKEAEKDKSSREELLKFFSDDRNWGGIVSK
jgi:hypothetical protein